MHWFVLAYLYSICTTRPSVFDVGPTLYKCFALLAEAVVQAKHPTVTNQYTLSYVLFTPGAKPYIPQSTEME